ncbi:reverse transcriptase domain, reverse transcriptase zinc-binding domain protein [Tanacetum coccineum]
MTETMKQYMSKTYRDYGSGVTRPKINGDAYFKLKGQLLKQLRDNTFSGSDLEDANEHIEKVLDIVDLFHIPNITQDQIMLQASHVSLTGAARRASVSVMPFSTYTILGLGDLAHTRLTIELADRLIKHPKGIAENVLVRIGKFSFLVDFMILDIPEDIDVPLILR